MFTTSSQYYDLIYSSFKNYRNEAEAIVARIKHIHPDAKTVLDVACGTAEHARFLSNDYGYKVDGIDLDEGLLTVARQKLPDAKFDIADMTDFELHQKYDVVQCLFSAVGYVRTLENFRKTLSCFRHHLAPGGLIIIEPWFSPEDWQPGKRDVKVVEGDGVTVCRMAFGSRQGELSNVRFEYLIGTTEGIRHEVEEHILGLFTVDEMMQCFSDVGLMAHYDSEGIFGRGLFTACIAP